MPKGVFRNPEERARKIGLAHRGKFVSKETGRKISESKKKMALAELPEVRFWKYVSKSEGCWEWTGARTDGRAVFNPSFPATKKGQTNAARFAYSLLKGEIPDGLLVCHTCDNPGCVNPGHLWLGSHKDNTADMLSKRRGLIGEQNGSAKLNYAVAEKIRSLAVHKTQSEIARIFGISQSNVSKIIGNKTWVAL